MKGHGMTEDWMAAAHKADAMAEEIESAVVAEASRRMSLSLQPLITLRADDGTAQERFRADMALARAVGAVWQPMAEDAGVIVIQLSQPKEGGDV